MNLTDYPTPRTQKLHETSANYEMFMESYAQLEREAAAWRAVAEMFAEANSIENFYRREAEMTKANQAFDALKSQLTQP